MYNFPSFMNSAFGDSSDYVVPAVNAADFKATGVYTCIDNNNKSKSFTEGMDYLCVKNYDQRYLVTNSGALVEVEKLKSTFVDFNDA